jgi:hypothetical protein
MLVLTLTDDRDGTDDAEPVLVTRADPSLVRAVLAVIVQHLGGQAASQQPARPRVLPLVPNTSPSEDL